MSDLDRRTFLSAALASLGLTALAGGRLTGFAQGTAKPYRIDIHHHFGPPVWVDVVKGRPLLQPANTTWTPAKSIEDMDRGAVAASGYDARRFAGCATYPVTSRSNPAMLGIFRGVARSRILPTFKSRWICAPMP